LTDFKEDQLQEIRKSFQEINEAYAKIKVYFEIIYRIINEFLIYDFEIKLENESLKLELEQSDAYKIEVDNR
jgi:hypothetical protein